VPDLFTLPEARRQLRTPGVYFGVVSDLTQEQIEDRRRALERLEAELGRLLETTKEGTQVVDLDEPIGRLTRMDAIQQQSVSAANRRSVDLRLRQVVQALELIKRDEYGSCRRCDDGITYPRLEARPESAYCLDCQDKIDQKHG
jgi:DnaK suppressor protein